MQETDGAPARLPEAAQAGAGRAGTSLPAIGSIREPTLSALFPGVEVLLWLN